MYYCPPTLINSGMNPVVVVDVMSREREKKKKGDRLSFGPSPSLLLSCFAFSDLVACFVYKTCFFLSQVHYFCNKINAGFVAAWSCIDSIEG